MKSSSWRRFPLLAFLCAVAISSMAGEGARACFYPLNAQMFQLERDNGAPLKFVRDDVEPHALEGLDGWRGEEDGNQTVVVRLGADGSPLEGYRFRNGRLARRMSGGRELAVEKDIPAGKEHSFEDLWPRDLTDDEIATLNIWHNNGRLKFGFVNPNYAAAFLGSLFVLMLSLFQRVRSGWQRVLCGMGCSVFAICTFLTGSRGGVLALVVAGVLSFAFSFRHLFSLKRILIALSLIAFFLAVAFVFHIGDRFTRQMFAMDLSNIERLDIWSAAPQMMVDAPWGWGWGQSGISFTNWYQNSSHFRMLGGMINSHLTILVETNWFLRVLYVFAWCWFLLSAFHAARKGEDPFPLATGVFFALVATFNSVMFSLWSWPVPIFALTCHLVRNFRSRTRFSAWRMGFAGIIALLVGAVFFALGNSPSSRSFAIHGAPGVVFLNGDNPATWYVEDGQVLDGGYLGCMGKEVRRAFEEKRMPPCSLAFTRSVKNLPAGIDKAVFVGKTCADFVSAWEAGSFPVLPKEIVMVSPPFSADRLDAKLIGNCKLRVVQGEFALRSVCATTPQLPYLDIARGAKLYIPGWLSL